MFSAPNDCFIAISKLIKDEQGPLWANSEANNERFGATGLAKKGISWNIIISLKKRIAIFIFKMSSE